MALPASTRRPVQGFLIALGAPAGWLLVRWIHLGAQGLGWMMSELYTNRGLYTYLLVGTGVAFGLFGGWLGRVEYALAATARAFETQAVTDPLTGLSNRRALVDGLAGAVARATRAMQPVSVIILDLDHFKDVNDRYGHLVGDRVLQTVAEALSVDARTGDLVARYGGEEFALVLEQSGPEGAMRRAERLRSRIAGLQIPIDGKPPLEITASFGVASWPDHAEPTPQAVLSEADAALYAAKRRGRNRCELAPVPREVDFSNV